MLGRLMRRNAQHLVLVGTLVARSAQCEVVVGTDWQSNASLQGSLVKEAENTKRENK
jgi:hypothetical protein